MNRKANPMYTTACAEPVAARNAFDDHGILQLLKSRVKFIG